MMQIDSTTQPTGSSASRARKWIEVGMPDLAASQRPDVDVALAADDQLWPLSPPPQPWPRIFPGL